MNLISNWKILENLHKNKKWMLYTITHIEQHTIFCKRVLVFEMNVPQEKYPSFKDKWTNCSLWLINEETWTNRKRILQSFEESIQTGLFGLEEF